MQTGSLPTVVSKGLQFLMPLGHNDIFIAIFQETSFSLNDNATHLQLRWIQPDVSESPAWFIDEIFIDFYPFSATIVFEEQDR